MPLMMRALTRKDLKYYYFYYRIGCIDAKCRRCTAMQEVKIFHHILDEPIIELVENILRKKITAYGYQDDGHSERVCGAGLRYFFPDKHRVGRVVKEWDRKELEALAPIKRRSIAWYYVDACIMRRARGNVSERHLRSKSFPAKSVELAERNGRGWLRRAKRRMKSSEYVYEADLFYANQERGRFSLCLLSKANQNQAVT